MDRPPPIGDQPLVTNPASAVAWAKPFSAIHAQRMLRPCSSVSATGGPSGNQQHLLTSDDVAARLRDWTSRYEAALAEPRPDAALAVLAKSNLSATLNLDAAVPNADFFWYINGHMPWIDALEQQMGVETLWRPGQTLLAIGGAHAMIDAFMSSKHGHRVMVVDAPWLYLRGKAQLAKEVRTLHCREIQTSPFMIHSMVDTWIARVPKPRSFDAVSFGGSNMSILQKAGAAAEVLLSAGCTTAKKWVLIFQEPLVQQGTHMQHGECTMLPHCRYAIAPRDMFISRGCNIVPNCRNESEWLSDTVVVRQNRLTGQTPPSNSVKPPRNRQNRPSKRAAGWDPHRQIRQIRSCTVTPRPLSVLYDAV